MKCFHCGAESMYAAKNHDGVFICADVAACDARARRNFSAWIVRICAAIILIVTVWEVTR